MTDTGKKRKPSWRTHAPVGRVETVIGRGCLSSLLWSLTPFSARTTNVYDRPGLKPATNTL